MYAAIPDTVRRRLQKKHGQRRRGQTPKDVLRVQAARRRLQAYQMGAYDSAESTRSYETGEQFLAHSKKNCRKIFSRSVGSSRRCRRGGSVAKVGWVTRPRSVRSRPSSRNSLKPTVPGTTTSPLAV